MEEQFQNIEAGFDHQIEAELASITRKRPARPTGGKPEKNNAGILTADVYQTADDIIIKSTIAGVTSDDLDISVTNEMVTIKGSRKPDERVSVNDYYHQELYWGNFSRSILLPEDIDADNAKATLKNGILTLKLPKLSKSRTKKLRVLS